MSAVSTVMSLVARATPQERQDIQERMKRDIPRMQKIGELYANTKAAFGYTPREAYVHFFAAYLAATQARKDLEDKEQELKLLVEIAQQESKK